MTTDVCLEVYSENAGLLNTEVTLYLAARVVKGRVISQSEFFNQCIETLPEDEAASSEGQRDLLMRWREQYTMYERRRSDDIYSIGESISQGDEEKAEELRRRHQPAEFIHLSDVEVIERGEVETVQKPLRVKLENVESWALGR